MKPIAVGDRVRIIAGKEEGYVKSIRKNIVEVEIEDGFIIPVLDKELAVISQDEKKYFKEGEIPQSNSDTKIRPVDGDLFLAIHPAEGSFYQLALVNQQAHAISFTAYLSSLGGKWQNLATESLSPNDYHNVGRIKSDQFGNHTDLIVNWMTSERYSTQRPLPYSKLITLRAKLILGDTQPLPLLNERGYLVNLSGEAIKIDADTIAEAMLSEKSTPTSAAKKSTPKQESVVDLHIENLLPNPTSIPKNDYLNYQLQYFNRTLDAAIAQGLNDITFIHGVGNGVLKYNIEKKLSGHPHIAYFKDAQKEKFGYGAIFIKLK